MSGAVLDALAESARNRGLKLVRSRVRIPGKLGYGKVGLTDAAGKAVFGIEGKTLSASAEEAAAYLRNLSASDWGASLDVPLPPRKKRRADAKPRAEDRVAPRPAPKPLVRQAAPKDVAELVPLMRLLDHDVDEADTRKRLATLIKEGDAPLVATLDKRVVGLCGVQVSTMIQRPRPVGRIIILVVAEDVRGQAISRMLIEAAEVHFRKAGCGIIEVTSRDEHAKAHAFYRHMGYERTSMRFAKTL
jgi:GNAT superfamily N-acetyltransferase